MMMGVTSKVYLEVPNHPRKEFDILVDVSSSQYHVTSGKKQPNSQD